LKPPSIRDFRGRRVLVTGASSGIGEALALAFAAEGARLFLVARDVARLDAVRARCAALGAQARVHAADLVDEAAVQRLADAVHADGGALDVLVNNAGVVMGGLCWEVEPADWRRLHEINVMGVVHGLRAFVPAMLAAGRGGAIVNMASVSGFVGPAAWPPTAPASSRSPGSPNRCAASCTRTASASAWSARRS